MLIYELAALTELCLVIVGKRGGFRTRLLLGGSESFSRRPMSSRGWSSFQVAAGEMFLQQGALNVWALGLPLGTRLFGQIDGNAPNRQQESERPSPATGGKFPR